MRLSCEVELVYSLAVSGGASSRSSRSRAALTLGKKAGPAGSSKEEVYLIVSTAKNLAGSKYKLRDNVSRVFSKFADQGKTTIRFKEPAHDVCISQADPTKLRELLNILKLTPQEQHSVPLAPLLPPKMQGVEKPKTKLTVKSRGDYPHRGLPSNLERFEAVAIGLNRVDKRLCRLQHLTSLDLSGNTISSLPEGMKDVSLVELILSGNQIAEFPEVLCSGKLAATLRLLNLSRNRLKVLPHKFPQLKALVQLRLDCNELQTLPRTFGKMASLKFFSASSNKLVVLPPSFPQLCLDSLDLFGNPFHPGGLVRRCQELRLPSLMELAGRVVKRHRLTYDPYTLPVTLCHYLDSARKCLCGTACFHAYLHHVATFDLHKVAATVMGVDREGLTRAPVEAFLCSAKCLRLWKL